MLQSVQRRKLETSHNFEHGVQVVEILELGSNIDKVREYSLAFLECLGAQHLQRYKLTRLEHRRNGVWVG